VNHDRVPALLTTSDANLLRHATTPRGRQRLAAWMIFFGGLAAFFFTVATKPDVPCSEATPCGPDLGTSLIFGLLMGSIVVAFLHRWVAALAIAANAVTVFCYDRLHPALAAPRWGYLALAGVSVWCVVWAGIGTAEQRRALRPAWPDAREPAWPGTALPPPPQRPIRRRRLGAISGLLLILVAIALLVGGTYRQARADTQQGAAAIITGQVAAHPDEFTLRVVYPDRPALDVDVQAATAYPVGTTVRLAVDDQGLRQLLSEPYDATFWHAFAYLLAVIGIGVWWRTVDRNGSLRRLFRQPQPASAVYVRRRWNHVLIFAGDASATDVPFAEIPVRDALMESYPDPVERVTNDSAAERADADGQVEEDVEEDEEYDNDEYDNDEYDNEDELAERWLRLPPEPAVLYGTPMPGQWCTVTLGQLTLSPRRPLRGTFDTVAFGSGGEPYRAATVGGTRRSYYPAEDGAEAYPDTDGDEIALTAERPLTHDEIGRLPAEDVVASPERVHLYRVHRLVAFGLTLSLPLVLAPWLRWLAGLVSGWALYGVLATCVGVALWVGWRMWMRPMVAWNGGGVTIRGAFRSRTTTLPWSQVTAVRRDGDLVTLHTRGDGFVLPARPGIRWLGGRDATELSLGLRHSRVRSHPGIAPPSETGRGDRRDAVLLWLFGAAMTLALGQFALLAHAVMSSG
jgi:Bacterial PH domain